MILLNNMLNNAFDEVLKEECHKKILRPIAASIELGTAGAFVLSWRGIIPTIAKFVRGYVVGSAYTGGYFKVIKHIIMLLLVNSVKNIFQN